MTCDWHCHPVKAITMASKTTPSPSRIPVPVRSAPAATPISACYAVREVSDTAVIAKRSEARVYSGGENGVVADASKSPAISPHSGKGKGFETFLMTGDMIIRTTPPHQKSRGTEGSPSPGQSKKKDVVDGKENEQMYSVESSPKITAPKHVAKTSGGMDDAKLVVVPKAPVASFEELSDMSQSSSSGEFAENQKVGEGGQHMMESPALMADTSRLDEAMETLGRLGSSLPGSEPHSADSTLQETPSSGDSGVLQDSIGSDSDSGEGKATHREEGPEIQRVMTTSMSDEKIVTSASKSDANRPLVRTSKSHENYLQSEAGMTLVTIDIDDNMAYSLDTLTYHDSNSDSSNEKVSELAQQARSLQNSPEKKSDHVTMGAVGDREFIPGFISLQDTKQSKSKPKQAEEMGRNHMDDMARFEQNGSVEACAGDNDTDIMQLSIRSDDSDAESLYHQPTKSVDQPSAARLAKRLFNLEGFRKSDVSRHLSKK